MHTSLMMHRPTDRTSDCLSWERTGAGGTSRWDSEQILVFGYSAKLFKDDEQAGLVEQGRHLVPCQGQADVRIDRFDVRGCLSSLQSFEPERIDLTPEEIELEKRLDDERFRDLISDEVVDAQEEEIKRLRDELASDGAYNQVAFSYDSSQVSDQSHNRVESDDRDFVAPENLTFPVGLNMPKTMRDHKLIEKTALFIHMNGPQMEIVLKLKQSSNPAFSFLNFDSSLNQYFRYILSVIKSGKYVPTLQVDEVKKVVPEAEKKACDSESEDEDGGYLHPSLMGGTIMKKVSVAESNPCPPQSNDAKSGVVKKMKADPTSTPTCAMSISQLHLKGQKGETRPSKFSILPPPPQEVQKIIDKLAEKVAHSGEEFESSIKRRTDPRFEFLNPGNCFHAHYVRRKLHYIEENQKSVANSKSNEARATPCSTRNISFSFIRSKSGNKEDGRHVSHGRDQESAVHAPLTSAESSGERESVPREKRLQEERKRKAAIFLSLLKSREQDADESTTEEKRDEDRGKDPSPKHSPSLPFATRDERKRSERKRRSRSRDRGSKSRDRSADRAGRKHGKTRRRSRSRSP